MQMIHASSAARRAVALAIAAMVVTGCDDRNGRSAPSDTTNNPSGTTGTTGGNSGNSTSGTRNGTSGTTTPPSGTSNTTPRPPDNTGVNKRDGTGNTPTPMDQGGSEADRRITADIRQAVVSEKGLSVNAQNCKIITVNGVVTLRGPVTTAEERELIASKARATTGVVSVINELEVTGK